MGNTFLEARAAKDALYAEFARIGKAVAHPKRLELLNLLGQGEHSVDSLAEATELGLTTASSHLQVLRQARLVETRKQGPWVYYRLADDAVYRMVAALQDVAEIRLAEVQGVVRSYFGALDELDPVTLDELRLRIERSDVIVIDVRPEDEFASGHIPGARSVPLEELADRLDELPPGVEIVAYCRGPYCVLAPQAVAVLRHAGRRARRVQDGFPEWRLAGLPVEAGRA